MASSTDADIDAEAIAAHLGGAIDIAARLADELAQRETRLITVELDDLNIVLAPFSDELLLCLIGTADAIKPGVPPARHARVSAAVGSASARETWRHQI